MSNVVRMGNARGRDFGRLRHTGANLAAMVATVFCRLRPGARRPRRPATTRLLVGAMMAIAAVAASMLLLDDRAVAMVRRLPLWLVAMFDEITHYGKSGWFLLPIGLLIIAIAAISTSELPRWTRLVLAALAARLGFLFLAIAIPGLFVIVAKQFIGRARPLVAGENAWFAFIPFSWNAEYASFPSGHGTTAFATAMAVGTLWPQTRIVMWIYALLIAVSRVVLTAHFPSDVVASAVVGILGAMLVRNWFAARRLSFAVGSEGAVHTLPGPSFARIKGVACRLFVWPPFRQSET